MATKSIMLVSDKTTLRTAVAQVLKNNGYNVISITYLESIFNGIAISNEQSKTLSSILVSTSLVTGTNKNYLFERIRLDAKFSSVPIFYFNVETETTDETEETTSAQLLLNKRIMYVYKYQI
jgi:hypothetical protein